MAPTSRPRSSSEGSGSSTHPTSMWLSGSRPRGPRRAGARSRSVPSTASPDPPGRGDTTVQGQTAAVDRVFREEYGRLIASLVRRFGDIDLAEEAAGEALVAALEKWPESGVPPNPGGWLTTTAGNREIGRAHV